MPARKKPALDVPLPAYSLPDGVELIPAAQEEWVRFTRLLPLNSGPRLLFVLVDSPTLRYRLAEHLASALQADGHIVARLDFTSAYYQPLQEIFDTAAKQPEARFCFLFGLERSLLSFEHRVSALTDLNFHRDQISTRLPCPLVIWTTDEAFTDLANNAPDFIAWRSGVFTFADLTSVLEAPYRQYIIDRFSKITLYSTTSDAPLAVDLERVFVKLTTMQRRRTTVHRSVGWWGDTDDTAQPSALDTPITSPPQSLQLPEREMVEEFTATVSINEALRSNRCLAVIGAPGAGKTTLLKYLALTFARRQVRERLELDEERLPIFIALRDFNRFLDDAAQRGESCDLSPQLLLRFLNTHFREIASHLNLPNDFFSRQLNAGRCVVLLDGLDEVADPLKRGRAAEVIEAFTRHYQGNRFVVTSRPRGYEGEAKQRLSLLYAGCIICDFDDDDMATFARSWYTAVTIDQQGDNPTARNTATAHTEDLLRAVRADERVKALARNPLLLSVLAMVHQRGVGLPQRRAELYDECTDLLLGYWDQTKGGEAARELATAGALTRSEKRALLEPVALWFHERGEQGLEADKEELEREIACQFVETFGDTENKARYRAALFLRVVDERAGLLVERETGVYAFSHLTVQEYLAARAIADRDDYSDYTLRRLHDPWWREVILLEVGHLSEVRHFGRRARKLTTDLIRAIRNAGSWLEDVLKRDLLFAARCLCDTGKLGVDDDLRQSLMNELITLWHTTPYEPQRREIVDVFAYAMLTTDGLRIRAELFHCLEDSDPAVRRAAVEALGEMGAVAATPATLEQVLMLTTDEDSAVRRAAVEALGEIGAVAATSATLERVLTLVADSDKRVRWAAAKALGRMGSVVATPSILERLLALMVDHDEEIRWAAAEALGRMGSVVATPSMLERLLMLSADEDAVVRSAAVSVLGEMGAVAATPATLERLLTLIADEDSYVRWAAARALGEMGAVAATPATLERLLTLTADKEEGIRSAGAEALGEMGSAAATPSTLERLLALTADENRSTRLIAISALGMMGSVAATPSTLERLLALTTDKDKDVRWVVAAALGWMGSAVATLSTLERLLALTADKDIGVRLVAMGSLGKMGSVAATPSTLERLLALTADENWRVCFAAAWALGQMDESTDLAEQLSEFWRKQLGNAEYQIIAGQPGRVGDIAYTELQRFAARQGRKSHP